MAKQTVAVQLIIFGKRNKEDLAGVLDDVAAAGYQGVETGCLADQMSGKAFKKMLDDRGLVHVGAHFGGPTLLSDLGKVIDWLGETGGTDMPISDLRTIDKPLEVYKQCGDEYNEAGRRCAEAGITLSYHNHSWELKPTEDGVLPLEYLYEQTDPALVKLCIDAYWVRDGGVDPAAFVAKHASRLAILHAKDSYLEEVGKRSFAPVGEGVLDFAAIFKAGAASPARWVVVEQDVPDHDRQAAECIASSRKAVRELAGL